MIRTKAPSMRIVRVFPSLSSLVLLVLAVCLCGPMTTAAQEKPAQSQPALASAKAAQTPDLSKEGMVLEKAYTRIRMEADGTGSRETISRVRVLADSGVKQMAVLTFTYTASNQQVEIGYVRVIKPDGTMVVTPDYNVQDMPADVTRQAPMYSDIHQKHVAVKGLSVGDTLESKVTLRTLKPEVPGQFWFEYSFEKNLIILDEQLDLDLPAGKPVIVASPELQPTVTTAAGRTLYHWASSNLARPDPDAPPKSTKHWKPSVQLTTFSSWEQIGAWYDSLQRDSLAVTPAIQAKAGALTKGLTTNAEKLQAIFNDVALHIHYVGLEFGIGRYQPHPADDVLSNQYGDCKDKHTLLAALLKAAGIEAWPVLISSGRELDPATPSPAQFDHVITLVPLDGKLLWMDSTEEVAPVGLLMDSLRDKQALAVPRDKTAYLERTPADAPSPRLIRVQVDGKLSSQGLFTGHIMQTIDGDVGILYRTAFRRIPQSQWKEALQGVAGSEGYAGEVSNPQVSDVEQIDKPFQFSYDYTREKYYQWDDKVPSHWISPPLPAMGGELAPGVKEKKPTDDPDLGSLGETEYNATIQLPEGWMMVPPKDVDLNEDWLEYHAKYSFKDGKYATDRRLIVKKNTLPLQEWEKYLTFRRDMFADWNFQTAIAPINLTAPQIVQGSGIGMNVPLLLRRDFIDNLDSNRVQQIVAAMSPLRDATAILETDASGNSEQIAKAVELSRKAVESAEAISLTFNPDDIHSLYWAQILSSAWSIRGWAALAANDLPTAENYLRAAWNLSQDRMAGYQLGRVFEAKREKAAAAHQYELASICSSNDALGASQNSDYNALSRIRDAYLNLTGSPLKATALSHGQYNGSLFAELNKNNAMRGFTKSSNLTGEATYSVSYEEGKPVKVVLQHGEKGFASMASMIEKNRFGDNLPAGSKARLIRQIRLICSAYGGGCDVYIQQPADIQMHIDPSILGIAPPTPLTR